MMHEAGTATEQTRERLLNAAREEFSQHGFQGATVREICRRAETNVAAVNYHFGSKDGLLAEALNFAPLKAMQLANGKADEDPEVRLRLFIRDFMLMLLDETNGSLPCRIMARELADPTPALDKIVREAIAPLHEFLGKLLREIAGE
ncbi:MAG: CerR family C-terminal domain-containing protein, partial [Candidatus Ferrigenium altingense]